MMMNQACVGLTKVSGLAGEGGKFLTLDLEKVWVAQLQPPRPPSLSPALGNLFITPSSGAFAWLECILDNFPLFFLAGWAGVETFGLHG